MDAIELTLKTVSELDFGKAEESFARHLKRVVADCMDRMVDKKARKLVLIIEAKPVPDQTGDCDRVQFALFINSTVPPHRSCDFTGRATKVGHLLFQPNSPDDVDQNTMDFDKDGGKSASK